MKNFSHLKLTSEQELTNLREQRGPEMFWPFFERVYNRFYKMSPGEIFSVETQVTPENRELFIKIVCFFIWKQELDLSFNNNFTIITKNTASANTAGASVHARATATATARSTAGKQTQTEKTATL